MTEFRVLISQRRDVNWQRNELDSPYWIAELLVKGEADLVWRFVHATGRVDTQQQAQEAATDAGFYRLIEKPTGD